MTGLTIIFEDDQILVVNKPAGIGTQAPRQFDSLEARVRNYLKNSLESEFPDREPYLGIPHRLDRCASGAIVFAKRKKAAQRLAKQFERREIGKTYIATVSGIVETNSGTWTDCIRKIPNEPKAEIVTADQADAKRATLSFEVIQRNERLSQLRIQLETGRMHQIRIQCAMRNHPILGDTLYESSQRFGPVVTHERERHIALHAKRLSFRHPKTREEVSFEAELPLTWDSISLEFNNAID